MSMHDNNVPYIHISCKSLDEERQNFLKDYQMKERQNFLKDCYEKNMLDIDALLNSCVHILAVETYLTMINLCPTISFFKILRMMEKIFVEVAIKAIK